MSAVSAAQAALEPSYVFDDQEVTAPIVTNKAISSTAIFSVSANAARRFIAYPDLAPAEIFPGRALFYLRFTDFVDGDLGSYNEVSMEFLVRHVDDPARPRYIADLSALVRSSLHSFVYKRIVDNPRAAEANRAIWGFPCRLGQINAEAIGTRYQGKLVVDGQHVMTFSVPFGGRRTIPEHTRRTLSYIGGECHETTRTVGAEKVGTHLGGARLTLGRHAVAGELQCLGLPKRALMSIWQGAARHRVEAPFPV